nr:MAG: hypothetical protein [Bacteriophage sp.]
MPLTLVKLIKLQLYLLPLPLTPFHVQVLVLLAEVVIFELPPLAATFPLLEILTVHADQALYCLAPAD